MQYTPRNVTLAFNHAGLTHYGGSFFLHEFLRVMQIRHFLARHLNWYRRNSNYTLSQMILALTWPLMLGLDRIETAAFSRRIQVVQMICEICGICGMLFTSIDRRELKYPEKSVQQLLIIF